MVSNQLAEEQSVSIEGISLTTGKLRVQKQIIAAVAATATGDLNTALTSSTTTYHLICKAPKAMTLTNAIVRTAAAGVAGGTLDLIYAASGTAMTSGTTMVTQVAGNGYTADTDKKLTINTDGTQNVPSGSIVFVKLVTGASETLKPLVVDLEFKL